MSLQPPRKRDRLRSFLGRFSRSPSPSPARPAATSSQTPTTAPLSTPAAAVASSRSPSPLPARPASTPSQTPASSSTPANAVAITGSSSQLQVDPASSSSQTPAPSSIPAIAVATSRSSSQSQANLTSTPAQSIAPAASPAKSRAASSILTKALEALDPEEQDTIRGLLSTNDTISIDVALGQAHDCATELQQLYASKRLSREFRGLDKILQLLDKFKPVGDVIAAVDPMHVGLPWAGINLILEVALSASNQRAALVTGLELSLYMSNRLKVYLEIYALLPLSLAVDNFYAALVKMHTHILQFLAQAILVQRKNSISRGLHALWSSDEITQFEEKCKAWSVIAGEEARVCDSWAGGRWRRELDAKLLSLDKVHDLQAGVTQLLDKADLAKLTTAREATYDSSAEGDLPRCLEGTRTDLLRQIGDWTANHQGRRIFWLCGKAGVGKSTISRTVAGDLDREGRLGASFFFKRGRADRSHAKLFFPTIAKQLADKIPDLGHSIAAALEKDSLLSERHMTKQLDKLLLQPMRSGSPTGLQGDCFLVVDALDECENQQQIETLLMLLKRIENVMAARIRILVTSRPDPLLIMGFRDMTDDMSGLLHDVQLEEAQAPSIKADLTIFFTHEIAQITAKYPKRNQCGSLSPGWAKQQDIDTLVEKSHLLFIVASTLCRLLSLSNKPQGDLCTLLSQRHGLSTGLGAVYMPVLHQGLASIRPESSEDPIATFRTMIGSLILLEDPLSISSLSKLLAMPIEDVAALVTSLRSVLNVPLMPDGKPNPLGKMKLFHLSFRDFLVGPDLAKDEKGKIFWIDKARAHSELVRQCLRLMDGALLEDVCSVESPSTKRAATSESGIVRLLPEEVAYACTYWINHAEQSGEKAKDDGEIHRFLKKHILHWLKTIECSGEFLFAPDSLSLLQTNVDMMRRDYMFWKIYLQIYLIASMFTSACTLMLQNSTSRSNLAKLYMYEDDAGVWGSPKDTGVAFSQDGETLFTFYEDSTIVLWIVATGEEIQSHKPPSAVSRFPFRGYGKILIANLWQLSLFSAGNFEHTAVDHSAGLPGSS